MRQLVEKHVAPGAAIRDEEETFPAEALSVLVAHGLQGIGVPIAYGGLGLDPLCSAVAIEEIAHHDGSTALTLASHNALACGHILLAGTEEQRRRYLPGMAAGTRLGPRNLLKHGAPAT